MLAALGSQGIVGYIQYFTHLPAGLVWVHVTGSVLVWIAVLRLYFTVRERAPVNTARTGPVVTAPSRQSVAGGPARRDGRQGQHGRPPQPTLPLDR